MHIFRCKNVWIKWKILLVLAVLGDLLIARNIVERVEVILVKSSYFSGTFRRVLHILILVTVEILKRSICCIIIVIIAVCFA